MALSVIRISDNATAWQLGRERGVVKMRYLTHPELVGQVCIRCLQYHDTVWDVGNANAPEPPLHPMCACTMWPEFDAGTELGQDPDGEPLIANPAPALKPGEFLARKIRSMTAPQIDRLLGPGRGKMIRAGIIEPEVLVSRSAGIRTVDALLRSTGITPDELRHMTYEELRDTSERRLQIHRVRRRRRRVSLSRATSAANLVERNPLLLSV